MADWHVLVTLRTLLLNVLGATLVFAGIALVAVTARAVLQFDAVSALHGGQVIDLGRDAVAGTVPDGHMVRVVGTPHVVEPARDPEFNFSVATPTLPRHVEMLQWHEVQLGANVQHELDWADHWLDFREPQGHANPHGLPLQDERFESSVVQIGNLRLAPVIRRALPGSASVAPDVAALPPNLAASFVRQGNYLQTSQRAGDPQLGDVRVGWDQVPPRLMTVVARLEGDQLVAAEGTADGQGYQVAIGDVRLHELFPDLPSAPEAVNWKRALSILLAVLGALTLLTVRRQVMVAPTQSALRRQRRNDLLLAVGTGALVVGAVAATIWAGHELRYAMWWAGVAVAGALLAVLQWHHRV